MKKPGTKTLETDRLVLRKIRESDCEAMFHNWAEKEKHRYRSVRGLPEAVKWQAFEPERNREEICQN